MRKLYVWAGITAVLVLILAGCANNNRPSGNQVQSLSVEELKKQLEAGIDKNTVIVDLRESFLYEKDHIPGAIWIPFADFEKQSTQLDHNKTIILVCHSGPMGEAAGQFLLTKEYTRVYNLDGGMRDWELSSIIDK